MIELSMWQPNCHFKTYLENGPKKGTGSVQKNSNISHVPILGGQVRIKFLIFIEITHS